MLFSLAKLKTAHCELGKPNLKSTRHRARFYRSHSFSQRKRFVQLPDVNFEKQESSFSPKGEVQLFQKKKTTDFLKMHYGRLHNGSILSRWGQSNAHSTSQAADCSWFTKLAACGHFLLLQMSALMSKTVSCNLFLTLVLLVSSPLVNQYWEALGALHSTQHSAALGKTGERILQRQPEPSVLFR